MITEISYYEGVDITASLEENLSRAVRDFQSLNAPISSLSVSVTGPELLTTCTIPDDFKEAFLQGSPYEGVRIYDNDSPFASPAPSTPNRKRTSMNTQGRRSRSRYGRRIRSGIIA